jgi:hypothetical protein
LVGSEGSTRHSSAPRTETLRPPAPSLRRGVILSDGWRLGGSEGSTRKTSALRTETLRPPAPLPAQGDTFGGFRPTPSLHPLRTANKPRFPARRSPLPARQIVR